MHEAALAAAVAAAIHARGLAGRPVRLIVSGGHSDVEAFDAALRLHLAASYPELDTDAMTIVHQAEDRTCFTCGRPFPAVGSIADCPHCGGVGFLRPRPEEIDIVVGSEAA